LLDHYYWYRSSYVLAHSPPPPADGTDATQISLQVEVPTGCNVVRVVGSGGMNFRQHNITLVQWPGYGMSWYRTIIYSGPTLPAPNPRVIHTDWGATVPSLSSFPVPGGPIAGTTTATHKHITINSFNAETVNTRRSDGQLGADHGGFTYTQTLHAQGFTIPEVENFTTGLMCAAGAYLAVLFRLREPFLAGVAEFLERDGVSRAGSEPDA
jgi:hypothetical protein